MTRYIVLLALLIYSGQVVGQGENSDSLDYIALKEFTDPESWINKYKRDPTDRLDQETFDYIKELYPGVNIEYSELAKYEYQKEKWDINRIESRKLKSNRIRIPLLGSPPRKKAICYVTSPLYLNDEKTIAIVYWSSWADLGWNFGSGFGEGRIFIFENGQWRLEHIPISGFTT